jgi:hypothetical protein
MTDQNTHNPNHGRSIVAAIVSISAMMYLPLLYLIGESIHNIYPYIGASLIVSLLLARSEIIGHKPDNVQITVIVITSIMTTLLLALTVIDSGFYKY